MRKDPSHRNIAVLSLLIGLFLLFCGIVAPQILIDRAKDTQNYYLGSVVSLVGIGIIFIVTSLVIYRKIYLNPQVMLVALTSTIIMSAFLLSMCPTTSASPNIVDCFKQITSLNGVFVMNMTIYNEGNYYGIDVWLHTDRWPQFSELTLQVNVPYATFLDMQPQNGTLTHDPLFGTIREYTSIAGPINMTPSGPEICPNFSPSHVEVTNNFGSLIWNTVDVGTGTYVGDLELCTILVIPANSPLCVTVNISACWIQTINYIPFYHYELFKFCTSAPWDMNHDGKVDMIDVGTAVRAFGTRIGSQHWSLEVDISGDGKVDMKDLGAVARHFGLKY